MSICCRLRYCAFFDSHWLIPLKLMFLHLFVVLFSSSSPSHSSLVAYLPVSLTHSTCTRCSRLMQLTHGHMLCTQPLPRELYMASTTLIQTHVQLPILCWNAYIALARVVRPIVGRHTQYVQHGIIAWYTKHCLYMQIARSWWSPIAIRNLPFIRRPTPDISQYQVTYACTCNRCKSVRIAMVQTIKQSWCLGCYRPSAHGNGALLNMTLLPSANTKDIHNTPRKICIFLDAMIVSPKGVYPLMQFFFIRNVITERQIGRHFCLCGLRSCSYIG